ncbi:MAG: LysE family translocator [Lautropia sp.]|nr:LysE family translocator [Lautropia sp.]
MITMDFLLTSLVVVLIPGTGVVYTVSTGLLLGWRASVAAAVGCTAGIVPHLAATVMGLAAILHMSAVAFSLVKFLGVAYLLYLAWTMWRQDEPFAFDKPAGEASGRRIVIRGFLLNILNPKLSIFFLAFLPQFVNPAFGSPLLQMLVLSGLFMAMTFVVFVVYGVMAHRLRATVAGSARIRRWIQRGFAGIFAALGVNLALSGR